MTLRTGFDASRHRLGRAVEVIRSADEQDVEQQVLELSRTRRWLAPLALVVSAFTMLFAGLKLLVSNWRLTLVQILPAMWIWMAMFDLKAHVLHGKSFTMVRGPVLIPVGVLIVAITVASFFLNAVFAFAIASGRPPRIRPAFAQARAHWRPILLCSFRWHRCTGNGRRT